jgi:hypothetical protein
MERKAKKLAKKLKFQQNQNNSLEEEMLDRQK